MSSSGAKTTSGGLSRLDGPDGLPTFAAAPNLRSPFWAPYQQPPVQEPDTLFLSDALNEQDVLAQGGLLHQDYTNYFTKLAHQKVTLTEPGVDGATYPPNWDGNTRAEYRAIPLPADQWTTEMRLRSRGYPMEWQPARDALGNLAAGVQSVGQFLMFGAPDLNERFQIQRGWAGANSFSARHYGTGTYRATADMVPGAGANQVHVTAGWGSGTVAGTAVTGYASGPVGSPGAPTNGQVVTGPGIKPGTTLSGVSGSGPYAFTLSQAPTSSVTAWSTTGDTQTGGSANVLINVASTVNVQVGDVIQMPNVPQGAVVLSKTANTITLNQNASSAAAGQTIAQCNLWLGGDFPADTWVTVAATWRAASSAWASFTATTTNASPTLTNVSSFAGLAEGDPFTGTNIPAGSYIQAMNVPSNQITLNQNASGSGSGISMTPVGTLWFFLWPAGSSTVRQVAGNTTYAIPSYAFLSSKVLLGTNEANAASGSFDMRGVHIRRYAREVGAQRTYRQRKVTVDAGTVVSTNDPRYAAGVFLQYPGWDNTLADGQTGGGGPGVTGNAIRNAEMDAALAAGCKFGRIDHIFDKVTCGGTAAATTVTDWSKLDGPMDYWHAGGGDFWITLDYTPSIINASALAPPKDPASGVPGTYANFSALCVAALTHFTGRGYRVKAVSLWNEPDGGSFWSGTSAEFAQMWSEIRAAIAAAFPAGTWPDLQLGPNDGGNALNNSNTMANALVDRSVTDGVTLKAHAVHAYNDDEYYMGQALATARAYLATKSISTSTPLWWGEMAVDNPRIAAYATLALKDPRILRHPTADVEYATRVFARIAELVNNNFGQYGIFTRLGTLDARFPNNEQMYGLSTNDNPPQPLHVYGVFEMLWKLSGSRVSSSTNFPGLRSLAAKSAGGVITTVFGRCTSWRPARMASSKVPDLQPVAFEWTGLPGTFTWKQWRKDQRDQDDGRMRLIGQGDQTNLPLRTDLSEFGVGCIQITP